ncbi:hypothetical protein TNCV_2329751 [Trichonephila clavipes]|nr:hypothetical protein TNCV_2329751 [Trichonephila clavipes]
MHAELGKVVTNATSLMMSDGGQRNSSQKKAGCTLVVCRSFSSKQMTVRFSSVPPDFEKEHPGVWSSLFLFHQPHVGTGCSTAILRTPMLKRHCTFSNIQAFSGC